MLEDRIKVGTVKAKDLYREVEPVSPYPRINPQQQRPEDYPQAPLEKRTEKDDFVRRRFTSMRKLIEQLKSYAMIKRVDYNSTFKELCDRGLAIAEEELIDQLLQLKIPLSSIEDLISQLQQKRTSLTPVKGRIITAGSQLFPVFVEGLSEYLIRFDDLQVKIGQQANGIIDEINNHGRCVVEHNLLRLSFRHLPSTPPSAAAPLHLNISILVGAIEIDETGRRAILFQRQGKNYGLYSDKSIDLSI